MQHAFKRDVGDIAPRPATKRVFANTAIAGDEAKAEERRSSHDPRRRIGLSCFENASSGVMPGA